MEKDMQKEIVKKLKELTFPLASIVVALVLGAVILSAMGYDAGKAAHLHRRKNCSGKGVRL